MSNPKAAGAAPMEATIAHNIQTKLDAANMSPHALSKATGIGYQTLCRRITTGKHIRLEELTRIAEALDSNVRDFLPRPTKDGSGAR